MRYNVLRNAPAGHGLQGGVAEVELPPAEKEPRAHAWQLLSAPLALPYPGPQPDEV